MATSHLVRDLLVIGFGSFGFFFGTYLLVAGAGYLVFWQWGRERFAHKRIQPFPKKPPAIGREIGLSAVTMAMLSATLAGLAWLSHLGWTQVYWDIATHGWGWFAFSVLLMMLVHDTYYYWAHRWMHSRLLFRRVHRVHHDFTNPTPFASYAFHPLEGVIEIAVVILMLFLMPIHPAAFAAYLTLLTVLNAVSHLGYEFYPAWVSRWFITATHHNFHHSRFTGHYMLYFNVWDRWMGSNYADYHATCARLARAKAAPEAKGEPATA